MEKDSEKAGRAARAEFRVGEFLVRPRLGRVEAGDGRVLQVQPKIMDVLVLLAGRPGEVVTREELFETIWAGTHVSEHVLARAISELRKIFGDRPQSPRFIETIPKTGYRLVAEVSRADGNEVTRATREEARDREDAPRPEAEAHARPDAASPVRAAGVPSQAFATALGPTRTNFWVGVAALSCAALLVVFVIILIVTRDAGHAHLHLHH